MSKKQFQIIEQTTRYQGFFRLDSYTLRHSLFAGGWSKPITRELFRRGHCVAVILYDPDLDQVVLIEQFRVGAILEPGEPWLLEIVAGALEEGETAAEVAHREALEEAGCSIEKLLLIRQFFTTPGGSAEWLSLFCGKVDSSKVGGIHGLQEEDEDIRVTALPFQTVYGLLEQGKIISAIPIIAIQWLYIHRETLRQQWQS